MKNGKLIRSLEKDWDMILFDNTASYSYCAAMVSKIDSIVIVVKVGQTDKKALNNTIIKKCKCTHWWVVLNAVNIKTVMVHTTTIISTIIITV